MQIELGIGKRVKVKSAQACCAGIGPAELIAAPRRSRAEIDLDLAWEFAPSSSRPPRCSACSRRRTTRRAGGASSARRRRDRQGGAAGHRAQEGRSRRRSRPGPPRSPPACPAPVRASSSTASSSKPDKNAPGVQGRGRGGAQPRSAPAGPAQGRRRHRQPYQFHWRRFLFEQFPQGTGFPPLAGAGRSGQNCRWRRARRSRSTIRTTTEIDDALSVQGLGTGHGGVQASTSPRPGLAFAPTSALDKVARERPVHRLHAGLEADHAARRRGAAYTLTAGRDPRRSLYVTLDEATLEVRAAPRRAGARAHRRQPAPRPARRR